MLPMRRHAASLCIKFLNVMVIFSCSIIGVASCSLRSACCAWCISSVVLRHPSCHIIFCLAAPPFRAIVAAVSCMPRFCWDCRPMCWRAIGNPNGNAVLLFLYIYNVQLMLTEERRKIPVPSREWLGTGYCFFANRERGLEVFALSTLSP